MTDEKVEVGTDTRHTDVHNKSILMICASFFGYDVRICRALQNIGYEVDLIDEKPNNSFIAKACIRYNVGLYRPAIRKYYQDFILQNQDKEYDYILVVKGEAINEEISGLLRDAYPNAHHILYLWDSVANIPDCEKRMKLYDRVLTFDPKDAQKYQIPYLPIPYDEMSFSYAQASEYRYDVAFIGTAHSVRPRVIKQIQKQCESLGRTCFVYFYSPHILVYLFNKLTNRDYRFITLKDIHFQALSAEEVCQIYNVSKCVLDIEHPKQSGATTRPVEMLPMRKKIITTNRYVEDFPFYNNSNYSIIDRNAPKLNEAFLDLPYVPVEETLIQSYSPREFATRLLGKTLQ